MVPTVLRDVWRLSSGCALLSLLLVRLLWIFRRLGARDVVDDDEGAYPWSPSASVSLMSISLAALMKFMTGTGRVAAHRGRRCPSIRKAISLQARMGRLIVWYIPLRPERVDKL